MSHSSSKSSPKSRRPRSRDRQLSIHSVRHEQVNVEQYARALVALILQQTEREQ